VAGKKRNFPGDDSKPGTTPAARLRQAFYRIPDGNLVGSSASIEIDLAARGVVENEIRALWEILNGDGNFWQRAAGYFAKSLEGRTDHKTNIPGYKSHSQYYPGKNLPYGRRFCKTSRAWARTSGSEPAAAMVNCSRAALVLPVRTTPSAMVYSAA
jgi:hypothetical protein